MALRNDPRFNCKGSVAMMTALQGIKSRQLRGDREGRQSSTGTPPVPGFIAQKALGIDHPERLPDGCRWLSMDLSTVDKSMDVW